MLATLLCIIGNFVLGAIILSMADDKEETLYNWYKSCPRESAWFCQPFVLFFWPVTLWFWLKP